MLTVWLCIIIGLTVIFQIASVWANIKTIRMIRRLERELDKYGR